VAAAFAALVVFAAPRARAQQGTWALTNARIETVTRGVIERGTIVIRDGLIVAVGADVTAPADARVVDLIGRTVYPGLIDLTSTLGLPAAPAGAGGQGAGGGGAGAAAAATQAGARVYVGLEPDRLVADELRPAGADLKAARDAGITAVLTAPGRGAFRGRSALVPLRDSVTARDIVRSPVALHLGYQGTGGGFGGGGRYPATLLGVIAYERQAFYDAKRQALLLDRFRTSPRGMQRPPNDANLAALIPVVKGELPAFFAASNENEIRRALGIAREFNLQMTIVGATEGFLALDALTAARRPVVVSVDYPRAPDVTGWQYRSAQRHPANDSAAADSAGRRVIEGNAAALMRAGVRFALASGGGRPADFLPNVRKAIAAGLPRDTALAAVTIRAAEIAGVADQIGSIEQGKAANLVVSEGDLFGDSAKIRLVFVDGIRYAVEAPAPAAAAGRGRGGPGGRGGAGGGDAAAGAQVAGVWDLNINSPQGAQQVSMTVTQDGFTFAGSMTSQMGTTDISSGTIAGQHLTWSMALSMGGQTMTLNYSADVDGSRITGTVSVGDFGSFPFTGEKRP
jgi:imidazolonepropionase-like amidohydrolase